MDTMLSDYHSNKFCFFSARQTDLLCVYIETGRFVRNSTGTIFIGLLI